MKDFFIVVLVTSLKDHWLFKAKIIAFKGEFFTLKVKGTTK